MKTSAFPKRQSMVCTFSEKIGMMSMPSFVISRMIPFIFHGYKRNRLLQNLSYSFFPSPYAPPICIALQYIHAKFLPMSLVHIFPEAPDRASPGYRGTDSSHDPRRPRRMRYL